MRGSAVCGAPIAEAIIIDDDRYRINARIYLAIYWNKIAILNYQRVIDANHNMARPPRPGRSN
jgi:hypothetical protein